MKSHHAGYVSPTLIAGAVGVLIVVGALGYAKVQSARLNALQAEYGAFQAQVKANGEAALKAKQAKEVSDKAIKEKIDNETKTLRASNAALGKRLHDAIATSGGLRGLPTTTGSSDLICFDRAALDRAIQNYRRGFLAIAEKGAAAIADYSLALKWAAEITH